MSAAATADMRAVWDTPAGSVLVAKTTLYMEGDAEDRPAVITAGKAYRVTSMHPIADPPFVKLIDDHGTEHTFHGDHLRAWFNRGEWFATRATPEPTPCAR
jgi:hypothetical protein